MGSSNSDIPFSYNADNEQKLISYYFSHPEASLALTPEYFLHPTSQAIVKGVQELTTQKLEFNLDTIVALGLKHDTRVSYKLLHDIQETHKDFTNIHFCKETLVSDWARYKGTGQLFEKVSEQLMSSGQVSTPLIREYAQQMNLLANTIEANNIKSLLTFADLVDNHRQEIEERSLGQRYRSMGFRALDRKLTSPGAVGQYTLAFGLTGSGKTTWLKNAEMNMAQAGIPVVSFNIEFGNSGGRMGTAIMDIITSIIGDFSVEQLHRKNIEPRLRARIQLIHNKIAALHSYLFYGLEELSLDNFDIKLAEAREHFRQVGVLGDDGYMMATCDLLSDLDEFGEESKEQILKSVKHFDRIIKRRHVHAIALVQANENKIRGGKMFNEPDELDKYRLNIQDIFGGSAYAKKARTVISLHRPNFMKLRFFPDHPLAAQWETDPDIINCHVVKQTMGKLSLTPMLFDPRNMRISAVKDTIDDRD